MLTEAQQESRSRIGAAQSELANVLQAIEDTEKRLEERHAERDRLVNRGKEQLQNIESQITLQQEVITLSLSPSLSLIYVHIPFD